MVDLILASASPRRLSLLQNRGYNVTVVPSDFDEDAVKCDDPSELVKELALGKGMAVAKDHKNSTVLSADTVVVQGDKILGKPHDYDEAYEMLTSLSDSTHTVFTGVCIIKDGIPRVFCERADVTFFPLSPVQIKKYIDSGSPFDKAGGYGIQDDAGIGFIKSLSGELSCVIGLPMGRVIDELEDR